MANLAVQARKAGFTFRAVCADSAYGDQDAALYRTFRRMVDNLQAAVESQVVIERATGILHAELGVTPAEAFRLLSHYFPNTNQRVRVISARLVHDTITAAEIAAGQSRSQNSPTSVAAAINIVPRYN